MLSSRKPSLTWFFVGAFGCIGALGCSSTGTNDEPAADLAMSPGGADLAMSTPDLAKPSDSPDLAPRCALPFDLRPIEMVSTGVVTIQTSPTDPMLKDGEVDATAGGFMGWQMNPFVYIDLINGKKVDINDVEARSSDKWDIAFKRWQIKSNSDDSGPGGVTVAAVEGKELADVTKAPMGPFASDSYFDMSCKVKLDPISGLLTAMSDWYEYEMGTSRLVPAKRVYVLKRRDGKGHIKLQLKGYYKGTTSANYTFTWGFLP